MVKVRVLRLVQVAGVDYPPDTLLFVTEQHAERLVKLGLVAIVTTTPAPTYSTRIVTATRTMPRIYLMPDSLAAEVGAGRFRELYQDPDCYIAEVTPL